MSSKVQRILVPVDNSEGSSRGAAIAAELATALGASLTLLHVFDRDAFMMPGAETLAPEPLERGMEMASKRAFAAAADAMAGDFASNTETRVGKPSMEIVRFAKEKDIDLIVMGSRGLGRFKELLVGSVSAQVVHHAPCSVTIVR